MMGPTTNAPPAATPMGDSSFTILENTNFTGLQAIASMNPDDLNYSFSVIDGTLANNMRASGQVVVPETRDSSPRQQNQSDGLYTSGGDFLLPTGEKYVGYFHIHQFSSTNKKVAMVGRSHTAGPHATLNPISERGRKLIRQGSQVTQASTTPGATPGGGY